MTLNKSAFSALALAGLLAFGSFNAHETIEIDLSQGNDFTIQVPCNSNNSDIVIALFALSTFLFGYFIRYIQQDLNETNEMHLDVYTFRKCQTLISYLDDNYAKYEEQIETLNINFLELKETLNTGYKAFKINEGEINKLFNLVMIKNEYEPRTSMLDYESIFNIDNYKHLLQFSINPNVVTQ